MHENDYTENLFRSIDTIIAERIKNLPYDTTEIVEIVDNTNANAGIYKVTADNQFIDIAYSDAPIYEVGDKVYVLHSPLHKHRFILGLYLKNDGGRISPLYLEERKENEEPIDEDEKENEDMLIELLQYKMAQEAVNKFPLFFVDGKTGPYEDLIEYSNYRPYFYYNWARKELTIVANFQAKTEIKSNEPVLTGLPTIKKDSFIIPNLFTWVEKNGNNSILRTAAAKYVNKDPGDKAIATESKLPQPSQELEGEVYFIKDLFTQKICKKDYTSSNENDYAWFPYYEPLGQLVFHTPKKNGKIQDNSEKIPEGTVVHIDPLTIPMHGLNGNTVLPIITKDDIKAVAQWIRERRGLFEYSNHILLRSSDYVDPGETITRTHSTTNDMTARANEFCTFSGKWNKWHIDASTNNTLTVTAPKYGVADCSGIIHQAFKYATGKFVPNGATSLIGFGKIVTWAKCGEPLDMSKVQEGDLLGFVRVHPQKGSGLLANTPVPSGISCHHVAIAISEEGKERVDRLEPLENDDDNERKIHWWHMSTSGSYGCYRPVTVRDHNTRNIESPVNLSEFEKKYCPTLENGTQLIIDEAYEKYLQPTITYYMAPLKQPVRFVNEKKFAIFGPQPISAPAGCKYKYTGEGGYNEDDLPESGKWAYSDSKKSWEHNLRIVVRWVNTLEDYSNEDYEESLGNIYDDDMGGEEDKEDDEIINEDDDSITDEDIDIG